MCAGAYGGGGGGTGTGTGTGTRSRRLGGAGGKVHIIIIRMRRILPAYTELSSFGWSDPIPTTPRKI